jgi:hypothetical protein
MTATYVHISLNQLLMIVIVGREALINKLQWMSFLLKTSIHTPMWSIIRDHMYSVRISNIVYCMQTV